MAFLGFFRRRQNQDNPLQFLDRTAVFFEEAKRELTAGSKPATRQVLVVRRELDMAKPMILVSGLAILMLGIGIGWWFKDSATDSELTSVPMTQAKLRPLESEPDADKLETLADDSAAAAGGGPIQHSSSQDTLSQKVNDLLERVKRGE